MRVLWSRITSGVAGATRPSPAQKIAGRDLSQRGFSLLEMLVVLAIMGLIAAFVAPRLFNQVDRSKQTVARAQAKALESALETLRLDLGRYPTPEEGLTLLMEPPSDPGLRANWFGPYMREGLPADPWGAPYRYSPPQTDQAGLEQAPFVFTFGADNQPGGTGLNSDIGRVAPGAQ